MRFFIIFISVLVLQPSIGFAQFEGYPGYAFAIEKSELASSETGVISKLLVKEGDFVKAGQPLVQLDSETYELQLRSAQHDAENRTEIEAVKKRMVIQEKSLEKLTQLMHSGNARPSEVERETMELEVLRSSYQQKLYDLRSREIQLDRARALLAKRTIIAPFAGQVAKLHRRVGEFVSPNTPEVVTLVDTSELRAEFQVPVAEAQGYKIDQQVNLRIGDQKIVGRIKSVGILVEPASQTLKVRVAIENDDLQLHTGTDCVLITPY